jgi:hypothetical protein
MVAAGPVPGWSTGWRPHRKVLTAGTAGPVLTAGLALATPHLSPAVAALAASLVTAAIAYLVPSPTPDDSPDSGRHAAPDPEPNPIVPPPIDLGRI